MIRESDCSVGHAEIEGFKGVHGGRDLACIG